MSLYLCISIYRALNILISYNNKPANKAIPAFQEVIIPLSQQLFTNQNPDIQNFRSFVKTARNAFDNFLNDISGKEFTPLFVSQELLPLYKQSIEVADQFVPLLTTIAEGRVIYSSLIIPIYIVKY